MKGKKIMKMILIFLLIIILYNLFIPVLIEGKRGGRRGGRRRGKRRGIGFAKKKKQRAKVASFGRGNRKTYTKRQKNKMSSSTKNNLTSLMAINNIRFISKEIACDTDTYKSSGCQCDFDKQCRSGKCRNRRCRPNHWLTGLLGVG